MFKNIDEAISSSLLDYYCDGVSENELCEVTSHVKKALGADYNIRAKEYGYFFKLGKLIDQLDLNEFSMRELSDVKEIYHLAARKTKNHDIKIQMLNKEAKTNEHMYDVSGKIEFLEDSRKIWIKSLKFSNDPENNYISALEASNISHRILSITENNEWLNKTNSTILKANHYHNVAYGTDCTISIKRQEIIDDQFSTLYDFK